MKIEHDYNLLKLNTFGISARAKFFTEVHEELDLTEIFNLPELKNIRKLFLGGGSNVLFTKDFDGLVILNKLKGIEIYGENSETVEVRAMGGENWHDLVVFAVERKLWGIENLALIPGTVGAAPMQNIGAYGVELKDVLKNVEALDVDTGEKKVFTKEECKFGYRDSIFKNELKGRYFIMAVTLVLSKVSNPNLSYKVLWEYLENKIEVKNPKASPVASPVGLLPRELWPRDISDAVSSIRKSKLPDPVSIPNAGSFFKNIFLQPVELKKLQKIHPNVQYFDEGETIKVPAAWLIEQCGWKGKRLGNVGVHEKQALVLVNYGEAKGEEVLTLASKIIADVKEKFGLDLVPEVNLI